MTIAYPSTHKKPVNILVPLLSFETTRDRVSHDPPVEILKQQITGYYVDVNDAHSGRKISPAEAVSRLIF